MESYSSIVFIFIFIFGFWLPKTSVAYLGINYGQIANNLPSPENAIPLVQSIGANKVKIFDADPRVLRAFANTDIEIIVGVINQLLPEIQNPDKALTWVIANVKAYFPATKITGIAVGNEVLSLDDSSIRDSLVPAMHSLYSALVKLGLDKQVIVTTPNQLSILETSYPPSNGTFKQDLVGYINGISNFHVQTGSPFFLNAYPFFAYKDHPREINLDYVLFKPNQGIVDPVTNFRYDNMLFAQIDAVYSALAFLGYKQLPIHIAETGWPSNGDGDETGATLENAKEYNGNLMQLIADKKGTPMRPNIELNAIIFALFNENIKPGPTSEKNYGLFKPDGTPTYPLGENNSPSSSGFNPSPVSTLPFTSNCAATARFHIVTSLMLFLWLASIALQVL